jgi:hypothetical protein
MYAEDDAVVAGLFESRTQADTAVEHLHQIGVTDADVEVGTPQPGRYRFERHEAAVVWTAVRKGIVVGAVVGAVISMGVMSLVVPGQSWAGLIELGVPMGAAWGMFFGGLTGMALKSMTMVPGEPRYAVPEDSSEVLVVVHAHDRYSLAHEVLEHEHPHHLLTDVPDVRHEERELVTA